MENTIWNDETKSESEKVNKFKKIIILALIKNFLTFLIKKSVSRIIDVSILLLLLELLNLLK